MNKRTEGEKRTEGQQNDEAAKYQTWIQETRGACVNQWSMSV